MVIPLHPVERIYVNETQTFGNNSGEIIDLTLLIFDINDVRIGGRCCFMQEQLLAADWSSTNCGTISHEFNHKIHRSYDIPEENWISEGIAEYSVRTTCGVLPAHLQSFIGQPDAQLLPVVVNM